jgi:Prealbumin-like fold domain
MHEEVPMPKLRSWRVSRLVLLTLFALAVLLLPSINLSVALTPPGIAIAKDKHGNGKGKGHAKAASVNKDDDEGDDDQGDDEENGGPNHNCKGDEGKGKKKGHEKQRECDQVTAAKLYLVAVACQFQSDANSTTCLFVGGTENGTSGVTGISIPSDMVCSNITGGSYKPSSDDGGQTLTSPIGASTVTLVLAGRVRTTSSASYRVTTPNGLFPATGPDLRCGDTTANPVSTELSSAAGAIRVVSYQCPAGIDPQTVNWYATCAQPAPGVTFRLVKTGVSSDSGKTGTTDDKGNLTFANLPPATYHMTEDDGNWCHAESDSVNAQGDVIVRANERSTVWIFHCA